MRKSMVILLLAWWLVAPAWGAELPREVRDALPAAAEEITEELEDPASLSEGLSRLWDRALGYVEEAVRQSIGGGVVLLAAASEPMAPIAMPISARDSTGASLMPSPTKASLPPD